MHFAVDINLLIDAVVRQTTVLIAQLATSSGNRTPLAHTANQVFLSLVQELKRQGLGNKVIADMFGMALRTYHDKVQRLSESQTFRGRSLWEAVLQFVQDKECATHPEIMQRFRNDDERSVRGILTDLVDSGLLSRSGKGDLATFRVASFMTNAEDTETNLEGTAQLLWVTIHRFGPLTEPELVNHIKLESSELDKALQLLQDTQRISKDESRAPARYEAQHCVIPVGTSIGWEAAVFDHYQAVVTAICTKLDSGVRRANAGESVGGSTYTLEVWPGHPHEAEVVEHLQRLRQLSVELRRKVEEHNQAHAAPEGTVVRKFISYVGQTAVEQEEN
jgi:hypothetical protein